MPIGQFKGQSKLWAGQPTVACVLAPHNRHALLPLLAAYLFKLHGKQTEGENAPMMALDVPIGQPEQGDA